MNNSSEPAASSSSDQDFALLFAWKLYFGLDDAYLQQKQNHQAIRQWMILLSLLASVLAVLVTQGVSTWLPILQIVWLVVLVPGILWRVVKRLRHGLFYKPVLSRKTEQVKDTLKQGHRERQFGHFEAILSIIKGRTTYSISRLTRAQHIIHSSKGKYQADLKLLKASDPQYKWQYRVLSIALPLVVTGATVAATLYVLQLNVNHDEKGIKDASRLILIALPIAIGGLLAYASEFTPSKLWVVYRHTSQRILREIVLYRTQTGPYAPNQPDNRAKTLLKHIAEAKITADSLSGVAPYLLDDGQLKPITLLGKLHKSPNSLVTLELYQRISDHKKAQAEAALSKSGNGATASSSLANVAADVPDDGLSPITCGEDYIRLRLRERRTWYGAKIAKSYRQTKRTRQLILVLSAIGALAAGISLSLAWLVVLTTAITAAITTFHQLTLNSAPLDLYQQTAYNLDAAITDWRLLSPDEQGTAFSALIEKAEGILEQEEEEWFKTSLQVLAHLDQTLTESAEKLSPSQPQHNGTGTPTAENPVSSNPLLESAL